MNRVAGQLSSWSIPTQIRPHQAAGLESNRVDGAGIRHLRSLHRLLQRLSLAAATHREPRLWARLLCEREVKITVRAEFQNIFNRLYYTLPTGSGGTFTTSPTLKSNTLSGTRPVIRRLRLCRLGERGRIQHSRHRAGAPQRPDCGEVPILRTRGSRLGALFIAGLLPFAVSAQVVCALGSGHLLTTLTRTNVPRPTLCNCSADV